MVVEFDSNDYFDNAQEQVVDIFDKIFIVSLLALFSPSFFHIFDFQN